MKATGFSIIEYESAYTPELLRLLLELHETYFRKNASKQVQEFKEEKDIEKSYREYIEQISKQSDDSFKIYLAATSDNKITGFIMGSIERDEYLVNELVGTLEDWYVEEEYRGKGIGMKLYEKLERWFKDMGCVQLVSDTWEGNEPSIKAHLKSGFFVSGIMFSKKLK